MNRPMFNWDVVREALLPLLQGTEVTIKEALVTMLFATVAGIILGGASLSHFGPLRWC